MSVGELSIVVSLAGLIPYAKQVIWGDVRPQRATWLILTVILAMSLLGYRAAGGGDGFWFLVGDFLATGTIFGLSIFRGMGGWDKLDIACLGIATLGLLLWQLSNRPLLVLIGVVTADMMGVIPTIKKALIHPDSESASTFTFSAVAAAMGFVATGRWNWGLLFYPLYLFLANGITAQVIMVSQYQVHRLRSITKKPSFQKSLS